MEFYLKRRRMVGYQGRLRWSEAANLIRKVRKQYRLPPVTLKRAPPQSSGDQAWIDNVFKDGKIVRASITIDSHYAPVTCNTVLHELAHIVTDIYFPDAPQPHGREYVGVVSWLYDYYKLIPADAFGLVLRRYGVKRRPVRFCSPEVLLDRC
jgi:hypothetical protein